MVWVIKSYLIFLCHLNFSALSAIITKRISLIIKYIVLMQVSGSLYGALFGSLIVYPIADFLGVCFAHLLYPEVWSFTIYLI